MSDALPDTFDSFFCRATGKTAPFDYQRRLAEGEEGTGNACVSRLIDVPTGCGKTAAVVLAWLWNRVRHPDKTHRAKWPRRLVYCLPIRTLVEQTRDEVARWLGERLWDNASDHAGKVGLHILMGGEEPGEWDAHPEADAVLIGTQDMLLSRTLNRGYGMSRARWPMHFGLLNNDCLLVFDETQLMGVGVETSAQLDAFRQQLGVQAACHCWWMSATLEPGRIETVDHPAPAAGWLRTKLGDAERESGGVRDRYQAVKTLALAPVALATVTGGDTDSYKKEMAKFIAEKHIAGTLTLVVVNRVPRAQAIYQQLAKSPPGGAAVALVHSRFRPPDRKQHERILFNEKDAHKNRIVIATQAVEAGVDVSARTLVTELAPWSSLVQRFGRCNRYGEYNHDGGGQIFWANLPTTSDKDTVPYSAADLVSARGVLSALTAVGPQDLKAVDVPAEPLVRPVIRRKDLLDLFDTTADLCGADLDISRYVRDGEDTDVQVYWREIGNEGPSPEERSPDRLEPVRNELCRVSRLGFAKFLKKDARIWRWDALAGRWEKPSPFQLPIPGAVYLIAVEQGGYNEKIGWTGEPKQRPEAEPPQSGEKLDEYGRDRWSFAPRRWVRLDEHVGHVVSETEKLCAALTLSAGPSATLRTAAAWHDTGKAHGVFQAMLHTGAPDSWKNQLLAKSGNGTGRCERTGFRHELASALLWLQLRSSGQADGDLVAYLIAAHHGKVRLSLRALPEEEKPQNIDGTERLFARGVWQGDPLPAPGFGPLKVADESISSTPLDLAYMRLGWDEQRGDSWLARMIRLRDQESLGPFRLAYLETVLRVADWRASAAETVAPFAVNPV